MWTPAISGASPRYTAPPRWGVLKRCKRYLIAAPRRISKRKDTLHDHLLKGAVTEKSSPSSTGTFLPPVNIRLEPTRRPSRCDHVGNEYRPFRRFRRCGE